MSLLQDDVRELVRRLSAARLEAGVSQKQIANMLGVPPSTISHVESGAFADPKASVILAYLAALGRGDWLDRVLADGGNDFLPVEPNGVAGGE